jgi:hypothetical protein
MLCVFLEDTNPLTRGCTFLEFFSGGRARAEAALSSGGLELANKGQSGDSLSETVRFISRCLDIVKRFKSDLHSFLASFRQWVCMYGSARVRAFLCGYQ